MKDDGEDMALDDPSFLERIAKGFEAVKIRPRSETASEIANANAGTRQFRDRAIRLRAISRRIRERPAFTREDLDLLTGQALAIPDEQYRVRMLSLCQRIEQAAK